MGLVVVRGAVIACSHGGKLKLLTGVSSLVVGGNGAVTSGMESGLAFGSPVSPVPGAISPCTAVTPGNTPSPCLTAPALPAGLSVKLTAGGQPVLLDSATGTTASGAGPGTWTVSDPGQQKLEAT
jgi:hypothetical protein